MRRARPLRLARLLRGASGQTTAEWLGISLLVAVVLVALVLAAPGIAQTFSAGARGALCAAFETLGGQCGPGGLDGDGQQVGRDDDGGIDDPRLLDDLPDVPGDGADADQDGGPGSSEHAENTSGEQSDPVNSLTGAFVLSVTDAGVPGTGVPFLLHRSYRSDDREGGALGPGWRHALEVRLVRDGSEAIVVVAENGDRVRFERDGGDWEPAAGVRSTLERTAEGWVLTRSDEVTYHFDDAGHLTALSDRNERGLRLDYDERGRLHRVVDDPGRTHRLDYDGDRLTEVRLADGRTVRYGYDDDGRLAAVRDLRGELWRYAYDDADRITEVIDAEGVATVTNRYGDDGRVAAQTDAAGEETTFHWDPDVGPGASAQTMVDARGNAWTDVYRNGVLLRRIDPLGAATTFDYDADLRLVAITDPLGHTSELDYDTDGNLVAVTDATGATETFDYDAADRLVAYTDARGHTTRYDHDASGNPTRITDADGTSVAITYDDAGQPTAVVDELGRPTRFAYDDAGNLTAVTSPEGRRTELRYDDAGNLVATVDPLGDTKRYRYDDAGNLVAAADARGNRTRVAYDAVGRVVGVADPRGARTSYTYDEAGRLVAVTAADDAVTRYAYDAAGNLVERTTAAGATSTFAYDGAGRLAEVVSPTGQRWSYEHDPAGRLARVVSPEGFAADEPDRGAIDVGYDPVGRLAEVTYGDGTPDVALTYDAGGNIVRLDDGEGETRYRYDDVGRPVAVVRDAVQLTYDYDEAGQLVARSYGEHTTHYDYDDDGLLTEMVDDGVRVDYGYDAAGQLTTRRMGNGVVEQRRYDADGQVERIVARATGGTLADRRYGYDEVGNLAWERDGERAATYGYDERSQLVGACLDHPCDDGDAALVRYSYDEVGNRTEVRRGEERTTYRYDADDRLVGIDAPEGDIDLSYDANGNLVRAGAVRHDYDLAGRLTATDTGQETVRYRYDGSGARLAAAVDGADDEIGYVWDPLMPNRGLVGEVDGDGDPLRRYSYGAGRVGLHADDEDVYYQHDRLGSVRALTDDDGDVLARYDYEPYGATRTADVGDDAPHNPMGFAGERRDEVTGAYHLRARDYDPELGRFSQIDPAGVPVHSPYTSVYAYANNRPTTLTDPSGACPFCPDISLPEIPLPSLPDVSLPSLPTPSLPDLADLPALPFGPVLLPGPVVDAAVDVAQSVIDDPWGALEVVTDVTGWISLGAAGVTAGAAVCSATVAGAPACGPVAAVAGTVAGVTGAVSLVGDLILTGRDCVNAGAGSRECITGTASTLLSLGPFRAAKKFVDKHAIDEAASQVGQFLVDVIDRTTGTLLDWIGSSSGSTSKRQ